MDTPAAEVEIDANLVARLVRAQHPDLEAPLRLVANGWDNVIYRLGTDLGLYSGDNPRMAGISTHALTQVPRETN